MDSGTISHIRNIKINKSFAKKKRRKKKKDSKICSPKICLSKFLVAQKFANRRVKISRVEDFRVAQFATYRPISQPCSGPVLNPGELYVLVLEPLIYPRQMSIHGRIFLLHSSILASRPSTSSRTEVLRP